MEKRSLQLKQFFLEDLFKELHCISGNIVFASKLLIVYMDMGHMDYNYFN